MLFANNTSSASKFVRVRRIFKTNLISINQKFIFACATDAYTGTPCVKRKKEKKERSLFYFPRRLFPFDCEKLREINFNQIESIRSERVRTVGENCWR